MDRFEKDQEQKIQNAKLILLKRKLNLLKKELQEELDSENDQLNTAFDSSIDPFKKLDVSKALIEVLEEKLVNC